MSVGFTKSRWRFSTISLKYQTITCRDTSGDLIPKIIPTESEVMIEVVMRSIPDGVANEGLVLQ